MVGAGCWVGVVGGLLWVLDGRWWGVGWLVMEGGWVRDLGTGGLE